jgi:hypothetical protein
MPTWTKHTNFGRTTLSADITTEIATTAVLTSLMDFPVAFPFWLTLWDAATYPDPINDVAGREVVQVTANPSALTYTIVRAQCGTSAHTHAAGAAVALCVMAEDLQELQDAIDAGGGAPHAVLSATHTDTLVDTVIRGDIVYGNATPKWARLPFPGTPTGKVLVATATDVAWSAAPLGTAAFTPATNYAVAAKGVTNGDSHDHNGGDGALIPLAGMANMATASLLGRKTALAGVPEVLSAADVKTLLAVAVADVSGLGTIATYASGDYAVTARGLPSGGAAGEALVKVDGTDYNVHWAAAGGANHAVLSATHTDTLADTVVRGDVLVGNNTPKWARLPFPATPTGKVLVATATDVAWSAAPLGSAAWAATGDFAAVAQTMYIGTTAVPINRGSGALSLAGVNIDGAAGSASVAAVADVAATVNTAIHNTDSGPYWIPLLTAQSPSALLYNATKLYYMPNAGILHVGARYSMFDETTPAHELSMCSTSSTALSADRLLSIDVVNADRTLKMGANLEVTATAAVGGTNTGDQVVPVTEAGAAHNFLTAYNAGTGAWTKAVPAQADITGLTTADSPTFAGLTIDSPTLYVDNANHRVGMGTVSPLVAVHVYSTSTTAIIAQRDSNLTTIGISTPTLGVENQDKTTNNFAELRFTSLDSADARRVGAAVKAVFATRAAGTLAADLVGMVNNESASTLSEAWRATSKKSFILNDSAIATNATDGFLYIATCTGTPTGVPTAVTGRRALVYDTTNDKLYIYNDGWKSATFA